MLALRSSDGHQCTDVPTSCDVCVILYGYDWAGRDGSIFHFWKTQSRDLYLAINRVPSGVYSGPPTVAGSTANHHGHINIQTVFYSEKRQGEMVLYDSWATIMFTTGKSSFFSVEEC